MTRLYINPDTDDTGRMQPMMGQRAALKAIAYEFDHQGRGLQVLDMARLTRGVDGVFVVIDPSMRTEEQEIGVALASWAGSTTGLRLAPHHGLQVRERIYANIETRALDALRTAGYLDDAGWLDDPKHPKQQRRAAEDEDDRGKAIARAEDGDIGFDELAPDV